MGMLGLLLSVAWVAPLGFRPWADDVFDDARRDDKPVLLIVAGTGCEALADSEFGTVATTRFVPVAVDGVERPEIVDLYRTAATLLPDAPQDTSRSLYLLTPERRPFAVVPCESRGIARILENRASEFQERRAEVEMQAGAVLAALRASQSGEPARGPFGEDAVAHALAGLVDAMDPVHGGYRTIPKTPPHGALLLLMEEQRRLGNRDASRLLKATLDGMARGGLHDPGFGVFVRAETEGWGMPEPRKRLVDNALLLRAYARAYETTGDGRYRETADELASFCIRDGVTGDGSFSADLPTAGRVEASRDERVFAGFNGLMLSGLAASGRKSDLAAGERAATAVLARLGPPAALRRFAQGSELGGSALLEDHAYLADGLLDLAEVSGDRRWVDEASAVVAAAVSRFLDSDHGGFFDTDDRHGSLPARIRNGYDGELPNANGVMASALLKLARATGEARHAAMARRTVEAFLGDLQKAPRGLETLAAAAGELLGKSQGPTSPELALPARVVRGPVTVEGTLSVARVGAGGRLEARVLFSIAEGHSINAHAAGKELVGLSVSVPGEDFVASAPRYPEPVRVQRAGGSAPAHVGHVTVSVPLRVRAGRPPGETRVRLRVGFQACDAAECGAPESVLLDIPLTLTAPGP